jgi:putative membrane-bound dehydrogenase-like protein
MRTFCRGFLIALLPGVVGIAITSYGENPSGVGPQAAAQSISRFKVADGLEVSLFASEPLVRNPTDMDIDERGRIWVTEGVNYRSTFQKWGVLQPDGDRIITLEYAPDGGVKETVFYQDPSINTALGVCVLGNKVIVSDSPNVFVLTDTDGDGKADKRELLFTGIGGKDHDHGVHTFLFGPDGKLYFNMGNEGKQLYYPLSKEVPLHGKVEQVPMKPVIDVDGNEVNNHGHPYRMGMVFRCNLDGSEVETLAWNFRNNYEVAVDSFGTLWQSDNDDDGNRGVRINYVMEYGNYGYADEITGEGWTIAWNKAKAKGAPEDSKVFYEWHQYDPGVVPDLLHTGAGSPTGLIVYEGKLLPEAFRNRMIHCDALPRVVRAYPTQHDGAGYRADVQNILTTEDQWFRPVDVCAAPDGSLYVADWNDAGVGGHYMADQNLETMTGRIYRLAPSGNKPSVPKLNLATPAGCVEALKSPNLSTRYLAWTKLHDMKSRAESSLRTLWKNGNEPYLRARALQLLARIPGKEKQYIQSAIHDGNPDLRITGLRIARQLKLDVIPVVQSLAHDSSPEVRRECAIALRHQPSVEAAKLWAELALQHDAHDRWYLEALGIGADRQWDTFLDAWLAAVGDHWDTPAGRDIVWRSRSKKTPALLVKIISDKNLTAEAREHYFHSLDFISGPEKDAALIQLLTAK